MKRASLACLVSSVLLIGLVGGCAGYEWMVCAAAHRPDLADPVLALAAAEEDDELPPDETVRLLRPEPEPPPAAVPAGPVGSRLRLGVRGGVLKTEGAERDWEHSTTAGLYLRQSPRRGKKVVLELGADYAEAQTTDGARNSTLYIVRGDLLFGRFGPGGATAYFFTGGHAIFEESTNNVTGETSSGRGGAAEAGLGLGARSGAWDLKATYSLLLASENAENNMTVSLGFSF